MLHDDVTVGKVFVPGGQPTITYNPRTDLRLEERVRDYLDERHRILSVSGPTKSGKTVLVRSLITEGVYLSGGLITSVNDMWSAVVDRLGVFTSETHVDSQQETAGRETTGGANVAVVQGSRTASEGFTTETGRALARERPIANAARDALIARGQALVIDDFHYIDSTTQALIVRALKDLVFDGLPVILLAVPHRAYDVVRVEKEMTGRVEQLEITFWSANELEGIAADGFAALNVSDDSSLANRLAREAFSSPHLMQEFCLQMCKQNDVRRPQQQNRSLATPDWDEFFRGRAPATSKSAFDLLARGPRPRSDRIVRKLTDGREMDIYGAVLAGIAKTGPLTKLTYEELRAAMREIMVDPPAGHEITRVLEEMSKVAQTKLEGEPVVDYDVPYTTLHISDPFFAYYLRWGTGAPAPN